MRYTTTDMHDLPGSSPENFSRRNVRRPGDRHASATVEEAGGAWTKSPTSLAALFAIWPQNLLAYQDAPAPAPTPHAPLSY